MDGTPLLLSDCLVWPVTRWFVRRSLFHLVYHQNVYVCTRQDKRRENTNRWWKWSSSLSYVIGEGSKEAQWRKRSESFRRGELPSRYSKAGSWQKRTHLPHTFTSSKFRNPPAAITDQTMEKTARIDRMWALDLWLYLFYLSWPTPGDGVREVLRLLSYWST
jgi:hypothetical protein